LNKDRIAAEPARDHSRYLYIESANFGRLSGIGFDKWGAAFCVTAPPELRASGILRRSRAANQYDCTEGPAEPCYLEP
jgi:hypothetical protein